jgi:hypothetical protein
MAAAEAARQELEKIGGGGKDIDIDEDMDMADGNEVA